MNVFRYTVIAGLLIVALPGCGSSQSSAVNFVESGKVLLAEGKVQKARLEFKNAIQIDPRMAEPFYQLALIDEKDQKHKAVFGEFTAKDLLIVGLDPGNPIEVTTQFDIPFDEDENYKIVIRPQKDQSTVDTASICLTNC